MSSSGGVVLAVDYGDRRTGLAVSDPGRVLAQPLPTLLAERQEEVVEAIAKVVAERKVGVVVVGMPLRLDGTEGGRAKKTRGLLEALRGRLPAGVSILPWDERFTTAEAHERLREAGLPPRSRRGRVDAVAAVILLRAYLEFAARSSEDGPRVGEA